MVTEQQTRILIVDDKEANLFSLEIALEPIGVIIDKALSGPEAIEKVKEHDYSVILLDVQMPGMDGFETATTILDLPLKRQPPIIFVTAISKEEHYILKGYKSGCVDYLLKPLNLDLVRNKVKFCMSLHQRILENEELIKQLKESEIELTRSNEELQQFAYVASHDLQEPIRMVRSYVQLFAKKYQSSIDEKADKYISYISEGSERMHNLIGDLLVISRVNSKEKSFEELDLNKILSAVKVDLKLLIDETEAQIEYDELPTVHGDAVQLRQIFQNLISNSIKFRSESTPHIKITFNEKDNQYVFAVKDNGIGINPKYFQQIFVIFQRLHTRDKYPGSGIGLSLCKKIIERHGGELWIESDEGAGSTFYFNLMKA